MTNKRLQQGGGWTPNTYWIEREPSKFLFRKKSWLVKCYISTCFLWYLRISFWPCRTRNKMKLTFWILHFGVFKYVAFVLQALLAKELGISIEWKHVLHWIPMVPRDACMDAANLKKKCPDGIVCKSSWQLTVYTLKNRELQSFCRWME